MPNKLSQFWQELKRRRVHRLMAIYAGSAYVVFEASTLIFPRWGLPDWTIDLVLYLLILGAIISFIVSWIYDVTPEGIRKTESQDIEKERGTAPSRTSSKRGLRISDLIIAALLVAVCVLLYPKIFKRDKFRDIRDEDGRISIAVMPFQNMTNDTLWNVWEMGIQNELITQLSLADGLSIRQFRTMSEILLNDGEIYVASMTPSGAGDIAGKLEANSFIIGSIKSSADIVRVNAWLYDTKSGEIYEAFQIDRNIDEDFFAVTDSLAILIGNYLEIEELKKLMDPDARSWVASTKSTEALKYFIQGWQSFCTSDFPAAVEHFSRAVSHDSSFYTARIMLMFAYGNQGLKELPEEALKIGYENYLEIEKMSPINQLWMRHSKSHGDKDPHAAIRYLEELLNMEPYFRGATWQQGLNHMVIHQFDKAVEYFEKAIEIDQQWEGTLGWVGFYSGPACIYHLLGNHKREKEILELGLGNIPEDRDLLGNLAICALSRGSNKEAEEYLTRFRRALESEGVYGELVEFEIGRIYIEAGMITEGIESLVKAVEIFRENGEVRYVQGRGLGNPTIANPIRADVRYVTGKYLIAFEQNVELGMRYIEEALKIDPDNTYYLAAKGLGLFKLDRVEEAKEVLEKAWELKGPYNHEHYLLLQEVNQALAGQ